MQTYASKIILLLAITVSQIVGGSSCCCRSRLLASTIESALTPTVTRNIQAEEFACPKCCRQRIESRIADSGAKLLKPVGRTASVSNEGKCNCVHHPSICVSEERLFDQLERTLPQLPLDLDEFDLPNAVGKKVNVSYSPPPCHRPFNRAWQCLACIWIV